jgi:hypothetical protein
MRLAVADRQAKSERQQIIESMVKINAYADIYMETRESLFQWSVIWL